MYLYSKELNIELDYYKKRIGESIVTDKKLKDKPAFNVHKFKLESLDISLLEKKKISDETMKKCKSNFVDILKAVNISIGEFERMSINSHMNRFVNVIECLNACLLEKSNENELVTKENQTLKKNLQSLNQMNVYLSKKISVLKKRIKFMKETAKNNEESCLADEILQTNTSMVYHIFYLG